MSGRYWKMPKDKKQPAVPEVLEGQLSFSDVSEVWEEPAPEVDLRAELRKRRRRFKWPKKGKS